MVFRQIATSDFRDFFRALDRIGYVDFMVSVSPISLDIERMYASSYASGPSLLPVLQLLLLTQEVLECEIEVEIRMFVPLLLECSLLRRSNNGRLSSGGLSLLFRSGIFFFAQIFSRNPFAYFGDDSIALSMRIGVERKGRSLDLCAGSGLQGLLCARSGMDATLVEINPMAASIARVNATINGLENVLILQGDIFAAVGDERFDIITANPPLLPVPNEVPYPFVGHGGNDGLEVTWRILEGVASHLSCHGRAQIIGSCLGTEQGPCPIARIRNIAVQKKLDIRMTCVGWKPFLPGSGFFKSLAATAALSSDMPIEIIEEHFGRVRSDMGASRLYFFFLAVYHGNGNFYWTDLKTDTSPGQGLWFI